VRKLVIVQIDENKGAGSSIGKSIEKKGQRLGVEKVREGLD